MNKVTVVSPNKKGSSELNSLDNVKNAIFFAGWCPRKDYTDDWRFEAIEILEDLGFDGIVLNPTNPNYNDIDLRKQTDWEAEAMAKASAIVFWIDRNEEHPAFTTNIEFGEWFKKEGVFIGFPKGTWKNEYIQVKCERFGKKVYPTLKSMLKDVVADLNREGKDFFTSDTHFSQQRTFELSKRPFQDVEDMDLNLFSNWNKKVRKNDIVYHLGDFGENYDALNFLNFKELHLVLGNYDREPERLEKLKKLKNKNIFIYESGELLLEYSKRAYVLKHEALGGQKATYDKDLFYLIGHTHGKNMFRRNGLDVGVDGTFAHYAPYSAEEIHWLADAVLKYSDENVFIDVIS